MENPGKEGKQQLLVDDAPGSLKPVVVETIPTDPKKNLKPVEPQPKIDERGTQ